jgi:hypothetical protein
MPEPVGEELRPGVRRRPGREARETADEARYQGRERDRRRRLSERRVVDLKLEQEAADKAATAEALRQAQEREAKADVEIVKAIQMGIEGQGAVREKDAKAKAERIKKLAGAVGEGAKYGGVMAAGTGAGMFVGFGRLWHTTFMNIKRFIDSPGAFIDKVGDRYKHDVKEKGLKGVFTATEWLFMGEKLPLPEDEKKK